MNGLFSVLKNFVLEVIRFRFLEFWVGEVWKDFVLTALAVVIQFSFFVFEVIRFRFLEFWVWEGWKDWKDFILIVPAANQFSFFVFF